MRLTVLSVLVAGTALVGCNRSEATVPGHAVANPVDAARESEAAPVATAGHAAASAPAAPEGEREIIIPSGTLLPVTLDTPVGSDTSRVEESVTAHLARPVRVQGRTVLAAGTRVSGVVTVATRSGKVKGRAHVAMRFNSLTPHGDERRYAIRTAAVGRTAQGTKQKDALEIGAPAAGGAIIGALVGGKKGALVGTAVGGGAGTAAVLSTRGKEVRLGKGAALTIRLTAPLTVHVRD
ncbi:MAG: hypothetical protein ACRD2I_25795 [Vicinamibacterales bacterium]